jgi:UDP-glucose 6-dehydrogenase
MNKIGVIGNGFVGSAIAEGFKHYADVKVYDSNPNKSPDNFQDVSQQEYIFICVPTPMSKVDGKCDMSYIYNVF